MDNCWRYLPFGKLSILFQICPSLDSETRAIIKIKTKHFTPKYILFVEYLFNQRTFFLKCRVNSHDVKCSIINNLSSNKLSKCLLGMLNRWYLLSSFLLNNLVNWTTKNKLLVWFHYMQTRAMCSRLEISLR